MHEPTEGPGAEGPIDFKTRGPLQFNRLGYLDRPTILSKVGDVMSKIYLNLLAAAGLSLVGATSVEASPPEPSPSTAARAEQGPTCQAWDVSPSNGVGIGGDGGGTGNRGC